jgi:hypothetical protein
VNPPQFIGVTFQGARPSSPQKKKVKKFVSGTSAKKKAASSRPKTQAQYAREYIREYSPDAALNRYDVGGGAVYLKVPLAAVSVSPPKSRQVQSAKKFSNSAQKKSRSPVPRPNYTQAFYRNEDLEEKTAAIQREYDALLNELLENR